MLKTQTPRFLLISAALVFACLSDAQAEKPFNLVCKYASARAIGFKIGQQFSIHVPSGGTTVTETTISVCSNENSDSDPCQALISVDRLTGEFQLFRRRLPNPSIPYDLIAGGTCEKKTKTKF